MDEISGKAKEYPSKEYGHLMSTLTKTRKQFLKQRGEVDQDERKVTAKQELDAWLEYMEYRKSTLEGPDFTIDQQQEGLLREQFDRLQVTYIKKMFSEPFIYSFLFL